MEKIPCIKYNPKNWNYIRENLESFGYVPASLEANNWTENPYIVINLADNLGNYSNINHNGTSNHNREIVTNVEEFLQRAAELKGLTYKRRDIMEINGISIKAGMIIVVKLSEVQNEEFFIVFPIQNNNLGLVQYGGDLYWDNIQGFYKQYKNYITEIYNLAPETGSICGGELLWKRKEVKEFTMEEIAKKLNIPIEEFKIVGVK